MAHNQDVADGKFAHRLCGRGSRSDSRSYKTTDHPSPKRYQSIVVCLWISLYHTIIYLYLVYEYLLISPASEGGETLLQVGQGWRVRNPGHVEEVNQPGWRQRGRCRVKTRELKIGPGAFREALGTSLATAF